MAKEILAAFFAEYTRAGFIYDPKAGAHAEFKRLAEHLGWNGRDDYRERYAHRCFQHALVRQFNANYGTDEKTLGPWQALCRVLRIDPLPGDVKSAREAVFNTHVNLVDLADTDIDELALNTSQPITTFETEIALSEYTLETEKFMSQKAVTGGVLRALLREILDPPADGGRRDAFGRFKTQKSNRRTQAGKGKSRTGGGGGSGNGASSNSTRATAGARVGGQSDENEDEAEGHYAAPFAEADLGDGAKGKGKGKKRFANKRRENEHIIVNVRPFDV